MLKVYDFTGSGNGYKTWLLLSQLGLPFQRIERDIGRVHVEIDRGRRKQNTGGKVKKPVANGKQFAGVRLVEFFGDPSGGREGVVKRRSSFECAHNVSHAAFVRLEGD